MEFQPNAILSSYEGSIIAISKDMIFDTEEALLTHCKARKDLYTGMISAIKSGNSYKLFQYVKESDDWQELELIRV